MSQHFPLVALKSCGDRKTTIMMISFGIINTWHTTMVTRYPSHICSEQHASQCVFLHIRSKACAMLALRLPQVFMNLPYKTLVLYGITYILIYIYKFTPISQTVCYYGGHYIYIFTSVRLIIHASDNCLPLITIRKKRELRTGCCGVLLKGQSHACVSSK